jgi:hypothetical protein
MKGQIPAILGCNLPLSSRIGKSLCFGLVLLLFTASFLMKVSAQGGGGAGLVFDSGGVEVEDVVVGQTVGVSLDIPQYLQDRSLDAGYVEMYKGLTYALVWDLGGPTARPPDLDTVRTATWTVLAYAHINENGILKGVMVIPSNATEGEHWVTAVYYQQSSDLIYTYWWGWVSVHSEATALSTLPWWLVPVVVGVIIVIGLAAAISIFLRRRGRHPATAPP